jgi:hypothetical protein
MRARLRVRAPIAFAEALIPLLLATGAARAADPSGGPDDASKAASAQALFDDGVKLMEAGRFGEACPKLAASERLDPGAGTLLNLGTCYEKNGQTASAWATFAEAESAAGAAGHKDWAGHAHARVIALEPRLQRLIIAVPKEATVAGLQVTRDGVDVDSSTWGVALPLDPGTHEIRVTAPNKVAWTTSVEIRPEAVGSLSTVSVPALQDVAQAPTPPPPAGASAAAPAQAPQATFWTTQRIIGASIAGAGLVFVGVGSGVGLAAKSKYDDARASDCPGHGTECNAAGVQQGQDAYGMATAATAMFVGGAVAFAVGAVVFAVPFSSEEPARGSAALKVTPSVAPGHASVSVLGAW